jgi:hypothetical protein
MSAITIVAIELQGRKWPKAWAFSLGGQIFWLLWIANDWSRNVGFLPMNIMVTLCYIRNHRAWAREARK